MGSPVHDATALTEIADCLHGQADKACLATITDCLVRALGVPSAFVAETLDAGQARVLACSGPEGHPMASTFALSGTACAQVLEQGAAVHGDGARRRFPADASLARLGIESFSGRALRDAADGPIGLLAIMGTSPLEWTAESDALLSILALLAELELRRVRSERKISRVARQWTATLDTMPDFVAVIAPDHRILRANLALARFASCSPKELVGRKCHEVLHHLGRPWPHCPHEQAMRTGRSVALEVYDPQIGVPLCVTCTPFYDDEGKLIGTVHVARDISEQNQAVQVREKLIGELEESLASVKALSGVLPICAGCKKIRNDEGDWEQVEVYIRDRTGASFSHGFCPECARELYPDHFR